MAPLRSTVRIARRADAAREVVSDAAGISARFSGTEHASAADGTRSCRFSDGHEQHEDVVDTDGELRRSQYTITSGRHVEHHLGSVAVLEGGAYSTPDDVADLVGRSIEGGVQGLTQLLESGS